MDKEETKKVDKSLFPSHAELQDVVQVALNDFWLRVAKRFPNTRSGDLTPETAEQLEETAISAVLEWWTLNCKEPEVK